MNNNIFEWRCGSLRKFERYLSGAVATAGSSSPRRQKYKAAVKRSSVGRASECNNLPLRNSAWKAGVRLTNVRREGRGQKELAFGGDNGRDRADGAGPWERDGPAPGTD